MNSPTSNVRVYHVHLIDGRVYGVGADRPIDARHYVHARLIGEGCDAPVQRIDSLGRCAGWTVGTVLAY